MKLAAKHIPDVIIKAHNLKPLIYDGYVYCKITGGMRVLPHAACLAWEKLTKLLTNNNYVQSLTVPGLWKSSISNQAFILTVDNFGIRCTNAKDLHHLEDTLNKEYQTTIDLTGLKYLGFDLKWNCNKKTCILLMPNNIKNLLQKLQFTKDPADAKSPF